MNQATKNIIVTGGNNGIGFQTAKGLFLDGHNVIIGSRNEQKNAEAVRMISESNGNKKGTIKSYRLDLASRKSIDTFVDFIKSEWKHVDILINNAGLLLPQRQISELNIEMTLTINHFGPFYLTSLLFPLLANSPQARIINVSSMAHYQSANDVVSDLGLADGGYSQFAQYYKSKLMNVMFTVGLADRIGGKYPHIKTASLHPGIVDSGFGATSGFFKFFKCCCCCMFVDEERGASTSLYLSRIPFKDIRNGEYYHSDNNWKEMNQVARNRKEVDKLWEASEKAYKIEFKP